MPTPAPDDLYWNPMDLDSDESLPYPKQYIDPWDLENYAYIRKHLDSVDLSSDPSSLGEAQETSGFYYIPGKSMEHVEPPMELYLGEDVDNMEDERTEKIYDAHSNSVQYQQDVDYYYATHKAVRRDANTLARSQRSTLKKMEVMERRPSVGNYAAIDELLVRSQAANARRSKRHFGGSVYGGSLPAQRMEYSTMTMSRRSSRLRIEDESYDLYEYDTTDMDVYGNPMQIYEKNKTLRRYHSNKNDGPVAKMAKSRSHSFSLGDSEYDPYRIHQPIYSEDSYIRSDMYDSTGSTTIYDDVGTMRRIKPRHFKLSNYGHLKIDYSFSWNNLNKYIYN